MKLKRNLKLLFVGLCLNFLIVSCNENETKKIQFKTENGILLSYPSDWTILKDELTLNIPVFLEKNENVGDDEFKSNINLSIISHKGESLDFNKFMQINKNYLVLNNTQIDEEEVTKIDGKDAYKIVYETTHEGDEFKLVQYLQLYDEIGYTITFVCRKENYEKLKVEATEIIESFKYDFNKK